MTRRVSPCTTSLGQGWLVRFTWTECSQVRGLPLACLERLTRHRPIEGPWRVHISYNRFVACAKRSRGRSLEITAAATIPLPVLVRTIILLSISCDSDSVCTRRHHFSPI